MYKASRSCSSLPLESSFLTLSSCDTQRSNSLLQRRSQPPFRNHHGGHKTWLTRCSTILFFPPQQTQRLLLPFPHQSQCDPLQSSESFVVALFDGGWWLVVFDFWGSCGGRCVFCERAGVDFAAWVGLSDLLPKLSSLALVSLSKNNEWLVVVYWMGQHGRCVVDETAVGKSSAWARRKDRSLVIGLSNWRLAFICWMTCACKCFFYETAGADFAAWTGLGDHLLKSSWSVVVSLHKSGIRPFFVCWMGCHGRCV